MPSYGDGKKRAWRGGPVRCSSVSNAHGPGLLRLSPGKPGYPECEWRHWGSAMAAAGSATARDPGNTGYWPV